MRSILNIFYVAFRMIWTPWCITLIIILLAVFCLLEFVVFSKQFTFRRLINCTIQAFINCYCVVYFVLAFMLNEPFLICGLSYFLVMSVYLLSTFLHEKLKPSKLK